MATYDLDLQDTKGGFVAGEDANLPLLQAWLESGGITVTSLDVDPADPSMIHVDASAEPDLQDSWPLYWNNTVWQTGDPLPTQPTIEEDFVPNATPDTVTYTLDLADTALGWTAGDNIRADQISQYLTDKGDAAQSVTPVVDGTGAQTGEIQVVRLASGSDISPTDWAAFNGGASVTVGGQNSVGEPPAGPVIPQSPVQGTHFGDESVASGSASTAFGRQTIASGDNSTAVGDSATASGAGASAFGQGAVASGDDSAAVGPNARATGGAAVATGSNSLASGNSTVATGVFAVASGALAVATGQAAGALADSSTASGASSFVPATSPRASAYGATASVPASSPDVGIWKNNSLELVPSRTGGTNDPTVFKPHDSAGVAHTLGTSATAAQWDGHDLALVTDITTAVAGEATARAAADALLVPRTAIPSGQYYSNANNGCYGKIATLACVANTGYFVPIELDYSSGSLSNISFNVSATGTATSAKWAIYARSASGNATGAPLATGTIALSGTGLKVGNISPAIALGAGLPNEYNLAVVFDGTVTLTALDVTSGGRNMYRSGNMLLNITAGRTTGVTFTTGFATTPTYSYTDQQIVPLMSLKAA